MIRWLTLVSLFGTLFQSRASSTNSLESEVERLAAGYLKKRTNGALVIGLVYSKNSFVRGFGRLNPASSKPPDADTVFEIGSITKAFTGITLAVLAEEGLLKLNDPAAKYLPHEVKLPERDGRAITLLDLATHTSGLRRLPDNLKITENPYATYAVRDLYECLSNTKLRRKPGDEMEYSNLAFGLLGHILERRAGVSYERLVRTRLLLPLGMSNTVIALDAGARKRLAPPQDHKGRPANNWDFDVLAGAGAFRSSAADMMKFLAANLDPDSTRIGNALRAAQKTHFRNASGARIGLGWHKLTTRQGLNVIWHNGGTGGYVSFLGFAPKEKVGVLALSNYGDALANDWSLDKLALELLRVCSERPVSDNSNRR